MRPRLLHELSRRLAILLEEGIRGGSGERRIPVYLSHPLDLLEERPASHRVPRGADLSDSEAGARPRGSLYLSALSPDRRFGRAGQAAPALGAQPLARGPGAPLWLSARFVFMVVGATVEEELGALAAALQCLHGRPFLDAGEFASDEELQHLEVGSVPVTIVNEPHAWRDLGLDEHRLAVVFEVSLPLPHDDAMDAMAPGTIVGRSVRLEAGKTPEDES